MLLKIFTFSHPSTIEEVLFLGQAFVMQIYMNLYVLRFFKTKNHVVNLCVHVCVIRINEKQTEAETPNLEFDTYITCRCFSKLSMKIEQKRV